MTAPQTKKGCYIPFDWQKDFSAEYLEKIKYYCLILSENYIRTHFEDIKKYASVIEERLDDVVSAYKTTAFTPVSEEHQGGWASLVYKK